MPVTIKIKEIKSETRPDPTTLSILLRAIELTFKAHGYNVETEVEIPKE